MGELGSAGFGVAALFVLVPTLGDTCGLPEVCSDVTASLTGGIISSGLLPGVKRVRLEWVTDGEQPGTISSYSVSRCASPINCTPVAHLLPVGSCGSWQTYELVDQPPAPVEAWTYRVAVIRRDGTVACKVEAVPR